MKTTKFIPLLIVAVFIVAACAIPSLGGSSGGGGGSSARANTEEVEPVDSDNEETPVEPDEPVVHTHTTVIDEALAPTCVTAGKTQGSHCSECSEVITEQQILPALGHDIVETPEVPATNTTPGTTASRQCSRCGEVFEESTTIPPIGYTVYLTRSEGGEHSNEDLQIILTNNLDETRSVWISYGGTYSHIKSIQLASNPTSSFLNYTMGGVEDVLYNQGTGNPSAVLNLTGNITIDCTVREQNCILADTLVTMADGSKKELGDIVVGDVVRSYDWETMEFIDNPVTYASGQDDTEIWTTVRYFEWTFDDGTVIKQAFAHRFYNLEQRKFVYLEFFNIGDHIYKEDGTYAQLVSKRTVYEDCTFGRITLQYGTNYFANGALTGDRHCPTDITFE